MALLGSGFDPGVTSVFTMWLKKHKLKTIRQLDILDCNGGDHGQHFATNFNPEINIREVTAPARHWEAGRLGRNPRDVEQGGFDFEAVGPKNMYLMYHEELESLAKFVPELERARFWMTFGDQYITHLTVLQNVGMTASSRCAIRARTSSRCNSSPPCCPSPKRWARPPRATPISA
jgi:saccharopine dehydrogenase (NAD+, L-lysine forming)